MTTNTVRPTKKQQELLVYIEQFIAEHGYSPSYREIMSGCQYNSVATVALHVGSLIKRGHLRKRDHSARSIEVVRNGDGPEAEDSLAGSASATNVTDAAATASTENAENPANPAGEKNWLIQQIERLLSKAEQSKELAPADVGDIQILLAACSVLGLEQQVRTLTLRTQALQQKIANG
jgi:hypothetical protein